MSLPTSAIYFGYSGKQIGSEFVNVGWFCDDMIIRNAVRKLNIPKDCETLQLYGKTFTKDEFEKIQTTPREERVYPKQEPITELKFTMPVCRKPYPTLLAKEILAVQPMTEVLPSSIKIRYIGRHKGNIKRTVWRTLQQGKDRWIQSMVSKGYVFSGDYLYKMEYIEPTVEEAEEFLKD